MSDWHEFPHDASDFNYAGDALAKAWQVLHLGDRVAWPDRDSLVPVLEAFPMAAPADFDGDANALAERMRETWRCFHVGDFGGAVDIGNHCGQLGHAPMNKATGIYASYLEPDETRQQALFLEAARRAEEAQQVLPEDPNSWYFHAFNLGRYSQSVSVVEALRQGIGGKIQQSLKRALELEPDHAEAHTAFGMYHAEIIDKVGKMIGGMTYGANIDKSLEHFQRALELTPDSPIAHMEYANGLYMLFGDKRLDEVTDLYVKASELTPVDAMEKLDVESALAELE